MMNVALRGDSSSVQKLLNEVAAALPQQVQRFVMEKVCFIVVGSAHGGQTWNQRYLGPAQAWGDDPEPAEWVIALSEDGITSQIFAHEIAHAFEAHNGDGPEVEGEADRLASEWGFPREQAD